MSTNACPVHGTITEIKTSLESGRIRHPKTRRIIDDILNLLRDIAWGMAGNDHLAAIDGLLDELDENRADPVGIDIRQTIGTAWTITARYSKVISRPVTAPPGTASSLPRHPARWPARRGSMSPPM